MVLFFLNWWLLELPLPHTAGTVLYIATLSVDVYKRQAYDLPLPGVPSTRLARNGFTTFTPPLFHFLL